MRIPSSMGVSIVTRDLRTSISIGRHARAAWGVGLTTLIGVAVACGSDSTAPRASSGPVYWALRLDHHAVNMAVVAPANAVRLTAVALDANGVPLPGLGQTTFSTSDTAITVDSTGLVTAHFATSGGAFARVVASLQSPTLNATHADTVFIQVTDTIPRQKLGSFSMQPAPGDSAMRPVDDRATQLGRSTTAFPWPARATDAAGDSVCTSSGCPLLVYYTSSRPTVASIDPHTGAVVANAPGYTVFTATTWYYGSERRDSVRFALGYRSDFTIYLGLSAQSGDTMLTFDAPRKVVLGVNARVTWQCFPSNTFVVVPVCTTPVDVVFDHPASIDTGSNTFFNGFVQVTPNGRGNIPAFGGDNSLDTLNLFATFPSFFIANTRVRRFPTVGTYRYHSTRFPSDTFEIVISPPK